MGPAHAREDVKLVDREVGHEAEGQPVCIGLRNQILFRFVCDFWVGTSVQHFEVAVKDQEPSRHTDQHQCEEEVLDKE